MQPPRGHGFTPADVERPPMTTELLCTPLHAWHAAHGGRMVDFAGWSMPVQYSSIADEHNATRNAVGVFDISHMGRLQFFGPNTAKFLDSLVTRRVADLKPNQVRYALACNEAGGILDDVLVYGPSADGSRPYSMVVNAGNREKIVAWLTKLAPAAEVTFRDDTRSTAMIAVQGPKAIEVVQPFITAEKPLLEMRYYTCSNGTVAGTAALVSRTGYTGEDGIEIICPAAQATMIWEKCLAAAMPVGGMAVGLGARDTLRLEAAMPLYGHELLETINPLAAGLNFAVNLGGREFLGSKALEKVVDDKAQPVRIGLMLETKRVPREHSAVFAAGNQVGEVTSGTFSPTLQQPIAMAYIQPQQAVEGSTVEVDIRGTMYPATIVPLPFYQRTKKN